MIVIETKYTFETKSTNIDTRINKELKELQKLDLFKLIDIKYCETHQGTKSITTALIIYQANKME